MVEMTMEDAQLLVEERDELGKMLKSKLFKKYIGDKYFKEEAARLANAATNPEMMDDIDQREIFSMLKGIGHLQNFFLEIKRKGDNAERSIEEYKEEQRQEELRRIEEETKANKVFEFDKITGEPIEVKDDE